MHHFHYQNGEMYCEQVPLRAIAEQVGTPTYVYSSATLTRHYQVFDAAFAGHPHLVCFAVKACSNIAVLRLLAQLGCGFDVVSGGELLRVLRAGASPHRIIYGGVGKTREEIEFALDTGVLLINVESGAELMLLSELAQARGTRAPVALRINPDIDPQTHPYIATGLQTSKFGIPSEQAMELYATAAALPGLEVVGIDCHIGSQLTQMGPVLEALGHLLELVDRLQAQGHRIRYLDLGGGLGISYGPEAPPEPAQYGQHILAALEGRDLTLLLEPGRVIAGNAGVLLMQLLYCKSNVDKTFAVVDAAMNDAMRPALYGAQHAIWTVRERPQLDAGAPDARPSVTYDIVGPVCETGDFLARDRAMPALEPGDLLAMMSAGAYGFAMASNYNSRRRAAEVLVRGDRFEVVRARESWEDLIRDETLGLSLEATGGSAR